MHTTVTTRQPVKPAMRRPMTAAASCALSDPAKRAHVASLGANERRALVGAVAAHHAGTRAKPSKPTGKSASQQQAQTWQKFAEKIWRTLKEKPQK